MKIKYILMLLFGPLFGLNAIAQTITGVRQSLTEITSTSYEYNYSQTDYQGATDLLAYTVQTQPGTSIDKFTTVSAFFNVNLNIASVQSIVVNYNLTGSGQFKMKSGYTVCNNYRGGDQAKCIRNDLSFIGNTLQGSGSVDVTSSLKNYYQTGAGFPLALVMISQGSYTVNSLTLTITLTALSNNSIAVTTTDYGGYSTVSTPYVGTTPTGGSGTYTYQWQSSRDNVNWTNIPNENFNQSINKDYNPLHYPQPITFFRRVVTSGGLTSISNTVNYGSDIGAGGFYVNCIYGQFKLNDPSSLGGSQATNPGVSYLWKYSYDKINWYNVPNSNFFDGFPGGSILTQLTYYKRLTFLGSTTLESRLVWRGPATYNDIEYICGETSWYDEKKANKKIIIGYTPACTTGYISKANTYLKVRAGECVLLKSGFKAVAGSIFKAYIGTPCDTRFNWREENVESLSSPEINNLGVETKMYPNPISSGKLNFGRIVMNYTLYNNEGISVMNGNNTSSIDVTDLASGLYIIKLDDKVEKLIIE